MMLAWIKCNKYLLGFLIAVIAIGYFGYGYYKSSTEVKETVRTRPLNMDIYRTAYQLPAV